MQTKTLTVIGVFPGKTGLSGFSRGGAALTIAIFGILTLPAAAQRISFSPADLEQWQTDSEVRICPDGKTAAYIRSKGERSDLYLVSTDGRARRTPAPAASQPTNGKWRDWSPRWAGDPPGGKQRLAYLSDRSGREEIHVYDAADNRDWALTGVTETPWAIALSPGGDAIAFTAPPVSAAAPALPYLVPARPRAQLFLVPVTGGPARRLTTGGLEWTGEPAWMPDGQTVLCAATPGADVEHPMQGGAIFSVRATDGAMTQLTQPQGDDSGPTPSPDGSRIAWISTGGLKQSYNVRHLMTMNRDGSRVKQLTGGFGRDVSRPQWSSDSRTVYFLAQDAGAAHVYAARNDGTVRQVTRGQERLLDFSLADNGRAAAIRSSAQEAGDIISFAIDLPGGVTTLDAVNEHLLAERRMGAVEEMHYDSAGHSIEAWLVKPPDFDSGKKYPLLLDVQDAPRAMYGYEFHLGAQIFAAAGFVTMLVNPRGAPGYGEEFGNLLATRNPGDDAEDLLRGVDAAAARGFLDNKRILIRGGLTAAWILGHSTRFASAVLRDPVADRAADILLAPDAVRRAFAELGGLPWMDPAAYWQHSPIYFAGNIQTPALIIARPGDAQARELFFALQTKKVDSALMEAPEGHEAEILAAEIDWLKR